MLRISFSIQNIFSKDIWCSIYTNAKKLTKNKYFETEVCYSDHNFFELIIDMRYNGRDHAGPSIEIALFRYVVIIGVYDCRHWNYKQAKWHKYVK